MNDIRVGDKVHDTCDEKIVEVVEITESLVRYDDGEYSGKEWAQDRRCPVQVGDRIQFVGFQVATVTDVVMYSGEPGVRYRYPEFPSNYVTSMEEAEEHLVKEPETPVTSEYPYGEPFPTGSIVQFKRTRYRVDGFDGEHHNLTPENGDVEGRLYFSPDFFELVQPPFPSLHEVWEDRNGVRYYVRSVNEDDNNVRISRFDGPDIIITVQQLHAGYTKLL